MTSPSTRSSGRTMGFPPPPSLMSDLPPLRSLDRLPNNPPPQLTRFIGRAKELAEVKEILGSPHQLLTLTGPVGIGKTRLALQVAADLLIGDGDGVWLVPLAEVSDP